MTKAELQERFEFRNVKAGDPVVVGYIALTDLTKGYSAIQSKTYDAFGPLFIIAVAYFCITKVLSIVFSKMERRLRESDRR